MSTFLFSFDATTTITGLTPPTLEILVGGVVMSSVEMEPGATSYDVFVAFTGTSPSSITLRFSGSSGSPGDSISISAAYINNSSLNVGTDLTATMLAQAQTSAVTAAAGVFHYIPPTLDPATISGDAMDNDLRGGTAADVIDGGDGSDRLYGKDNDDQINGGNGNDYLFGQNGADTILGGAGDDFLFGNADDDILYGEADNDYLIGGTGNDILNGGSGNDILLGDAGDDILFGEDGDDLLVGDAGDDILIGDAGNDTLIGGADNDQLAGGDDDDWLDGGAGNDLLNGGDGNDEIYAGTGNDVAVGGAGNDKIYGGDGTDILAGDDGDDYVSGGAGNDELFGDAGDDVLIGGAGADTMYGGADDDILHGHGLDATTISTILFNNPNVVYSQETGSFYQFVASGATWTASQTAAAGTTLNGVNGHLATVTSLSEVAFLDAQVNPTNNTSIGSYFLSGSDIAVADEWRFTDGIESGIQFWQGQDAGSVVNGFADMWVAGQPNDVGQNYVYLLSYSDGLADSDNNGFAHSEGYVIEWEGGLFSDDNAADILDGGSGDDWLYGYSGDDTLTGGSGDDFIFGGDGDDTIDGGGDDDYIVAGLGSETITGGSGADIIHATLATAVVGAMTVVDGGGGGPVDILTANFSGGTDGFTYADGVFGSSGSSNSYADGIRITTDGYNTNSGALQVSVGGINNNTITNMSGAYQETFVLTDDMANVTLDFAYRVIDPVLDGDPFDAGEDTQLFVDIDGTTYSNTANPYFFEITGSAAGATYDSGWQTISLNVGALGAGSHTISLGGNLASKTWNSEEMQIRFDDIVMQGEVATTVTLIDENFTGSAGSVFTYSDGGFNGVGDPGNDLSGNYQGGDGDAANGSLQIDVNSALGGDSSGSYDATVSHTADLTNVQITFSYRHWSDESTENGEDSEVYFSFNGTVYDGSGGSSFISQHQGVNGNGGDLDTGWQTVTVNLPDMSASTSYNLSIGIYHDDTNNNTEDSWLRIDDVTFTGVEISSGSGGNDATSSGLDAAEAHNIDGGDGDDIIYGSAGDDYLYGGAGSDIIYSDSLVEYTVADALAEIGSLQYNVDTGSFYLYVSGAVNAPTAFAGAAAQSLNGVAGHIVHITSSTENAYIDTLTGTATTWIGAQDTAVEGEWRWIGGVLDGQMFWQGTSTGSLQGGFTYENFNGGEPNDWTGGEDYMEIQNGGGWNDNGGPQQPGLTRGYVIEWEASEVFSFGATEMNGGAGADDLYGSAGADLFVFDSNSGDAFTNPDTIYNFDQNDGDAIDISDILDGLGVTSANLANFVDVSEANGVRIDTSGSGSFAGNEIATFSGFSGVSDEATMLTNGNLIIA